MGDHMTAAVLIGAIVGYAIAQVLVALWFVKGIALYCRWKGHDWTWGGMYPYMQTERPRSDGKAFCWRESKYVVKEEGVHA